MYITDFKILSYTHPEFCLMLPGANVQHPVGCLYPAYYSHLARVSFFISDGSTITVPMWVSIDGYRGVFVFNSGNPEIRKQFKAKKIATRSDPFWPGTWQLIKEWGIYFGGRPVYTPMLKHGWKGVFKKSPVSFCEQDEMQPLQRCLIEAYFQ